MKFVTLLYILIDNRDKNHNELYNIINGPDFPTGGTVIESKDNIIDTYKNGRGSFRLRANWILEKSLRNMAYMYK